MVELLTNLSAGAFIAAVAATAAAVSRWLADRQRKRREAREAEREQLTREALWKQLQATKANTPLEISFNDLLLSTPETNATDSVSALSERLEQVERRFPEESTLEKIASINDAILATKIEQLQKSIEQLEDRVLTKWDVATIVFTVIAAVGGLAGVVFAVANFVLK